MASSKEDEDDDTKFEWNKQKELLLLVTTLRKMPPWKSKNEDEQVKQLLREFLEKYSGGKVVPLLKSVLNKDERLSLSNIIKEEDSSDSSQELSQELIADDIDPDWQPNSSQSSTSSSISTNPCHITEDDVQVLTSSPEPASPGKKPRLSPISKPKARGKSGFLRVISDASVSKMDGTNVNDENGKENDPDDDILVRTSTPLNVSFPQRKRKELKNMTEENCEIMTEMFRKERNAPLTKLKATDFVEETDDEITIIEADTTVVDAKEEPEDTKANVKAKKKARCGKISLLMELRDIIGAEDDMSDDSVFDAFKFKETLYSSSGFVQGICPCKIENNIIHKMFAMEPNFPAKKKAVDVCPRCFNFFINVEKNEETKMLLSMIYQVLA